MGHKPRPWQQGSLVWAMELLENGLRVNRQMSSPFVAALVLEVLLGTCDQGKPSAQQY
ncbi:hypothetical protein [Nocardia grenadensis]|uniref:hypothetical protein n=1 Tax=Nocardia grenadensis TaxID=931537 RepID=UPI003D8AC361